MKIEKTEYGYQVTECDIKFGEQITLDGELLIPISVIEDIKAEIQNGMEMFPDGDFYISVDVLEKIIDKHISGEPQESEE